MFISEIAALRDQWYAVARIEKLAQTNPVQVRLFGEEYVLWRTASGEPVLHAAYCPHRGANLAAGRVIGNHLQCCYHGWQYSSAGVCAFIPQLEAGLPIPSKARLVTFPVVERYGLYWTCLGTPETTGPPPFFEADELGWRVQVDFFEPWAASALRIIDNNIDQAHPAFVHQRTFGDPSRPLVPYYELSTTPSGFKARIAQEVGGVGPQVGAADEAARFQRFQEVELLDLLHTRVRLLYGDAAPDYAFYGSATPLDDTHSTYIRISALEADDERQPYSMFWGYSRRVTLEDKVVLETTNPDFPVTTTDEVHLGADKTTVEFRRRLGRLLAEREEAAIGSDAPKSERAPSGTQPATASAGPPA